MPAMPAAPARATSGARGDRYSADREDGHAACDTARRAQAHPGSRSDARHPSTPCDTGRRRSGNQRRRRCRLVDGVNRSAYHRVRFRQQSRGGGADRVAAQVYAVGACGSGNVDAIVDEHFRGAAVGRGEASGHQRGQLLVLEIALTDLDQIDAALAAAPTRSTSRSVRRHPWTGAGGRSRGRS